MNRILLARSYFTCVLLALALPAMIANAASDEEAIRTCFKKYLSAVADKDGKSAALLICKPSRSYYGSILNLVLHGEESKVRQQHFYRKMMVLLVRHEASDIYSKDGYSTNAAEFFSLLVSKGWAGEVGAPGLELGKITKEVDVIASAPAVLNGQATPAKMVFQREADGWKLSLLDAILRSDKLMAEKQKNSAISEDDAIIQILEKRSGRPVSKDIWKPLKKK